jgi:hypothetical protein
MSETGRNDALRQEVLSRRQQIVTALERDRGTKVITLIHRRELWDEKSPYITVEDSEFVLAQITHTPRDRPIDLVLHTPGGLALASEMIAMALRRHSAPVTVIVPFYAMSGGTLIALAADEIRMAPYSVLGPVDPQVYGVPAAVLLRVLAARALGTVSDDLLVKAEVARLAMQNVQGFVYRLLEGRYPPEVARVTAEFLTGGYVAHDTPITLEVMASLGVHVREGIPLLVYDLFSTCAFGVCRRPCLAHYEDPVPGSTTAGPAPQSMHAQAAGFRS